MTQYVPTIGLEIHAELRTKSKMFCGCKNNPDETLPNANTCPICLGHPGTLPVLNKEAIAHVIKIGTAVNGSIARDFTEWDRKHYFYPDIPKGYQISQYKYPLVKGGSIAGVEITRIHLEEDTAKSTHDKGEKRLVDFNRSGVTLMELVTEPVIHDAKTAVNFAKELQLLLRYLGAGDANLEKGEMRIEVNISISPKGVDGKRTLPFGTKTEIKNLNSFKAVEKSILYEIERQTAVIENGGKVTQETRGWDDSTGTTFSQRAKESSHDYRYYPDPDIPKLSINNVSELNPENLAKNMPELPWNLRSRYAKDFEMTEKEVEVFVGSPTATKYFEEFVKKAGGENKKAIRLGINYFLSEYVGLLKKDHGENYEDSIFTVLPGVFAGVILCASSGKMSSRGVKDFLAYAYKNFVQVNEEKDIESVISKLGFIQNQDTGELEKVVLEVIAENPGPVSDFKAGKAVALQFLIGQGMKKTKGKGSPEVLKELFTKNIQSN